MTPEQKELIRTSFSSLTPKADLVAGRFYSRLFEMDPTLRPLFQGGLKFQRVKFMDMLGAALESIDHLDNVVALVWQLGKRHAGYGVKEAHYVTVRDALLETLRLEICEDSPAETLEAWRELYETMASAMKQAAAEGAIPRP